MLIMLPTPPAAPTAITNQGDTLKIQKPSLGDVAFQPELSHHQLMNTVTAASRIRKLKRPPMTWTAGASLGIPRRNVRSLTS